MYMTTVAIFDLVNITIRNLQYTIVQNLVFACPSHYEKLHAFKDILLKILVMLT
jgi:hypothetical protein